MQWNCIIPWFNFSAHVRIMNALKSFQNWPPKCSFIRSFILTFTKCKMSYCFFCSLPGRCSLFIFTILAFLIWEFCVLNRFWTWIGNVNVSVWGQVLRPIWQMGDRYAMRLLTFLVPFTSSMDVNLNYPANVQTRSFHYGNRSFLN